MLAQERVIIALDVPDLSSARSIVKQLGHDGIFYKIGYELIFAGGLSFVEELIGEGKRVFIDLKLHDIPNSIEKGVAQLAKLGATFLTVHAYPQTLEAAVMGAKGSDLSILGVSVLTSMEDGDLAKAGYASNVADLVSLRAKQAKEAGAKGLICSAQDIASVRNVVGKDFLLVTPGIRPQGVDVSDQKRIMTPKAAFDAGADYIVIGRPIVADYNPKQALMNILEEISS